MAVPPCMRSTCVNQQLMRAQRSYTGPTATGDSFAMPSKRSHEASSTGPSVVKRPERNLAGAQQVQRRSGLRPAQAWQPDLWGTAAIVRTNAQPPVAQQAGDRHACGHRTHTASHS